MDPNPSVLGRACSTFPYPNDRNVLSRRRSTARTVWFRFCLAFFQAVHVDSLIAIIIFTQVLGWSLHDFIQFYRPADCRAAMALARERDGGGPTEEDLKRAALTAEGNRVSLVTIVTFFLFFNVVHEVRPASEGSVERLCTSMLVHSFRTWRIC